MSFSVSKLASSETRTAHFHFLLHSHSLRYSYSKVSLETNFKVSLLANSNVSLLTKSKVEMVNISEGGGGEEVERYCENIIFKL